MTTRRRIQPPREEPSNGIPPVVQEHYDAGRDWATRQIVAGASLGEIAKRLPAAAEAYGRDQILAEIGRREHGLILAAQARDLEARAHGYFTTGAREEIRRREQAAARTAAHHEAVLDRARIEDARRAR